MNLNIKLETKKVCYKMQRQKVVQSLRKSNFEALRILSMFMIIGSHFCLFGLQLRLKSLSTTKVLLETLFLTQGRVGAILFFVITAYFLCVSMPSIHKSFKKVWILERTLLFWSLLLTSVSLLAGPALFKSNSIKDTIKFVVTSLFPVFNNRWWFVTSYVGFLIIAPFIAAGLKSLSQKRHLTLCFISLFLGFSTQIPLLKKATSIISFAPGIVNLDFIAFFIFVSYVRWYAPQIFQNKKLGAICLIIGYIWSATHAFTHHGEEPTTFNPSVVFEVIGWFIVFYNIKGTNKPVNILASHVFAIYLITEFPTLRSPLWAFASSFAKPLYSTVWMLPYAVAVVLTISLLCILLDIIKDGLFSLTIDRHKGHLFEMLWNKLVPLITAKFKV